MNFENVIGLLDIEYLRPTSDEQFAVNRLRDGRLEKRGNAYVCLLLLWHRRILHLCSTSATDVNYVLLISLQRLY